jgi:hypothetical protein
MPATRTFDHGSMPASELAGDDVEAAELHAVAIERVAGHVEAERLLLAHERLAQIPGLGSG